MELKVKCPDCGHVSMVAVPDNQCVLVHDCTACGARLTRQPGSCCVFCSYRVQPEARV